jgi:hypothetical protein
MPRRNVDDQVADLTVRDGFEVLDDGIDVPTPDQGCRGLDDRKSLAHELAETSSGSLAANLNREVWPCQQGVQVVRDLHRCTAKGQDGRSRWGRHGARCARSK